MKVSILVLLIWLMNLKKFLFKLIIEKLLKNFGLIFVLLMTKKEHMKS
nr:MAG TPA: hypothetical protein [Caudoviricetes sp.]